MSNLSITAEVLPGTDVMVAAREAVANARLIAASPELLRTLHQLIVVIERPIKYKSDLDILREAVDEALAVIAKATGRVMVELRAAAEIGRQHDAQAALAKNEQRLFDALESVLNELYWHENTIDDDGLWEAVEHAQGVLEGIAIEDADKS